MLVPRGDRRVVTSVVCALGFAGALVAAALLFADSADGHGVIADVIQRDRLGALTTMIVAGSGLLAVGTSFAEPMSDDHIAEYYALLAWAGAGMAFLSTASTLMTLFLGLEWFSISLYILCAIDRELAGSLEAGLKYLIVGGFGSAMLLFGSALVYGATGKLEFHEIAQVVQQQGLSHDALLVAGLALMIGGLGFKASAAPFHMWTPDVYEGAPTPVTAFMSAATKAVALVLMLRVLDDRLPAGGAPLDDRRRRDRLRLARGREPGGARADERQADARVLVDLARRLHADRDRREQRARRPRAPLLPDPVLRDVGRLVRGRRRARARAEPAGDDREPGRLRLGAAAARRRR